MVFAHINLFMSNSLSFLPLGY